MTDVKHVYLVVGGQYHDMDYARLELLKLLAEHEHMRVHVAEDYTDEDGNTQTEWVEETRWRMLFSRPLDY